MRVKILGTPEELGRAAAEYSADILNRSIVERGEARLLLSTGASQIDTLKALVTMEVDWRSVEIFHLDEYIGLPPNHPASFQRYLKEKIVDIVPLKQVHFVLSEGDIGQSIAGLAKEIRRAPIDLALIGIGENAHLAFNDPPADFTTREAYIIVNLDEDCKRQQVREGWFASVDDVPAQAISMSVHEIMQSRVIVSAAPYKVKARAIKSALEREVTEWIPATKLQQHPNVTLFLDTDSASLVDAQVLEKLL